jgi:hypothetical protein
MRTVVLLASALIATPAKKSATVANAAASFESFI